MTDPLETSLDPEDWEAFRKRAHEMLDAAMDRMQSTREGPVWLAPDAELKAGFQTDLPRAGRGGDTVSRQIAELLPYGVGNTHPRFFGWVHGAGTPSQLIAEIGAVAMNANLGGRDHGAMHVEKQVVDWVRQLFDFPATSSGLIVSGTSVATIIAMKTARDRALGFDSRTKGVGAAKLVGYTSTQTHACVARAFDMLGLGSDALRKIPVTDAYQIDLDALRAAIARDRAEGLVPFALIGTAGSVDLGASDDLDALATIAAQENIWFHVDGAFGAAGIMSQTLRPRLAGLSRADSLAFDFHKWLHVTYDAGFVLIRSEKDHRRAFSDRPAYLVGAERGLAAGNPWPVEYGPELSRGFRALKVWAQLAEHGTDKLGQMMEQNCRQAAYLGDLVSKDQDFELLAPVMMNICCFRYLGGAGDTESQNALTDEIVIQLQLQGIAAPSTTTLNGKRAIRVNLTNHRTTQSDLDLLLAETRRIGSEISAQGRILHAD